MATSTNPFQDFLSGSGDWYKMLLEEMPMEQYYSAPTGQAFGRQSPRQQRYFQNAYQDIFRDYLGATGAQMRAGQAPTSFRDYMKSDPWTKRYSSLPRADRGVLGLAANPRTRFLYNF